MKARPPLLEKFNYEFDVWPGDPMLEAVSTFIGDVEVTKSGIFLGMNGDRPLAAFSWLQIIGRAGNDDFGLSSSRRLVVSERVMTLLDAFGLNHCEVSEYDPRKGS